MSYSWNHIVPSLFKLSFLFSNIHLRFLHIILWLGGSFLLSAEYYFFCLSVLSFIFYLSESFLYTDMSLISSIILYFISKHMLTLTSISSPSMEESVSLFLSIFNLADKTMKFFCFQKPGLCIMFPKKHIPFLSTKSKVIPSNQLGYEPNSHPPLTWKSWNSLTQRKSFLSSCFLVKVS